VIRLAVLTYTKEFWTDRATDRIAFRALHIFACSDLSKRTFCNRPTITHSCLLKDEDPPPPLRVCMLGVGIDLKELGG